MKSVGQPRFMICHAATGESIPPESRVSTFGLLPTGKPPGQGYWCQKSAAEFVAHLAAQRHFGVLQVDPEPAVAELLRQTGHQGRFQSPASGSETVCCCGGAHPEGHALFFRQHRPEFFGSHLQRGAADRIHIHRQPDHRGKGFQPEGSGDARPDRLQLLRRKCAAVGAVDPDAPRTR